MLKLFDLFNIFIVEQLADSLASIKSITLSELDLPEYETNSDTSVNNENIISMFGRRFCNLNYKYIVYITYDGYMNNVDRFILEKKGKTKYVQFFEQITIYLV